MLALSEMMLPGGHLFGRCMKICSFGVSNHPFALFLQIRYGAHGYIILFESWSEPIFFVGSVPDRLAQGKYPIMGYFARLHLGQIHLWIDQALSLAIIDSHPGFSKDLCRLFALYGKSLAEEVGEL